MESLRPIVVLLLLATCLSAHPAEAGIISYFKDLFNMHKIQPMRSYTFYGSGNQEGHVEVDQSLPKIAPPKDIQIPEAMMQEMRENREIMRQQQEQAKVAQVMNALRNNNKNPGSSANYPPRFGLQQQMKQQPTGYPSNSEFIMPPGPNIPLPAPVYHPNNNQQQFSFPS